MDEQRETTEVSKTDVQQGATNVQRETVAHTSEANGRVVAKRIVWYLAGIIIVLLATRIILLLLAANQGNAFVDFIYALSGFFAMPFYGIFYYTPTYGASVLEVSSLLAILIYGVLAWGISKLFVITSGSQDVE